MNNLNEKLLGMTLEKQPKNRSTARWLSVSFLLWATGFLTGFIVGFIL